MWELIRLNQQKSFLLFVGMAVCLVALGYAIGAAFFPPDGGMGGVFVALGIWGFLTLLSLTSADQILLSVSGAQEITRDVHPQLYNIVEEMKIAAGLPKMPRIFIIPTPALNAFATGLHPERSAVAVTSGLLERLNRDELQGVIAHEIGHIFNYDVRFMAIAAMMLGSITLLSEVFLRGMFYSSHSRYHSRSDSRRGGNAATMILALVFAILAPLLAQLFYFAISRRREYLADATGARLTRYPEGLASALEKIAHSAVPLSTANSITAPMYIANPLNRPGQSLAELTATHPPIQERIRILRSMAQGAGYQDYQNAYAAIKGKGEAIIPPSGLQEKERISFRAGTIGRSSDRDTKQDFRNSWDLARALKGFSFVPCPCGLKIKIPAEFSQTHFQCPRCQRTLENPQGKGKPIERATIFEGLSSSREVEPSPAAGQTQIFEHRPGTWETFVCHCGHQLTVSSMFAGTALRCPKCGRVAQVKAK